ncbi:protein disulfide-isomerase A6 isoform X1 [Alligator mississippiensis]|uniref:Protein disulfide-isomerase A6 n=1 Tax=Alligator mississippiensis TaxID=8496 RepID=A0A151N847_ALLMI|nr:protein disulfide-isomerase A6 isoform X1 [Alligator mississippiensis]KYO32992.1 protein disulfide-isomerase A6 [Alligator mississippiensis]
MSSGHGRELAAACAGSSSRAGTRATATATVMGALGAGRLLLGALSCTFFLAVNSLYSSSDDVIELTPTNFNKEVLQSASLWLVEFYAPWCGHCQRLTPEWKKAATALKGVVKVGAVDADKHQSLGGQYAVKGFPTIKIFGANKNKAEDYQGGRTSEAIVDAALSATRSMVKERLSGRSGGYSSGKQSSRENGDTDKKDVVELTDDTFDKNVLNSDDVWLVEFYAPWCGHCKNLEPEWAAAATEVKEQTKGKVKLAAVDATVNQMLTGRYGIRGFPTIKIFQKGEDPVDYDGGRTRADIVTRALDLFSDNAPPPELLEVINADILKSTCEAHQLCIIAVLPHILDTGASGRNSYLEVMLKMAEKYKKKIWGWLWTEAGAQSDLESSLGIGGFGYPAMAAVNARKMKFALLKGSFSEQGINEFLRELSVGRGSTAPVAGGAFPKINTVEPWDGKDGELPVEDDIDLSDVDLDDWEKDEL